MMLYLFGIPFSSMKFVSMFHRFGDDFGLIFDVFLNTSTLALSHQKYLFVQWISMILPFQETWFLIIFLICFVTRFCIDCWWVWVSVLFPFWIPFGINFHELGDRFWDEFLNWFLIGIWSKRSPKYIFSMATEPSIFGSFFHTLVPFTYVRPPSFPHTPHITYPHFHPHSSLHTQWATPFAPYLFVTFDPPT